MRLAHFIICHINPDQVMRLVKALQHPEADIYIHVDKKVSIAPFLPIAELPNVYFIQRRITVHWGGYSIVEATISGLRQILDTGIEYDYLNLLSGQEYPLMHADRIHGFFSGHPGRLFMNIFPEEDKLTEYKYKLKQYYFAAINVRGKYTAEKIARILKPRKFPDGFEPMGTSQWFTIPLECAAYVLTFLEENKKIANIFRYMWAPDEMVFQSVLYNSPYRKAITNDNMRYIDWSEGNPSPKILTMANARQLIQSGSLFARKFDMYTDTEILDYLDKFNTRNNMQFVP